MTVALGRLYRPLHKNFRNGFVSGYVRVLQGFAGFFEGW